MCHRYSWLESPEGDVIFLTYDDVYNTKRGKQLQKFCSNVDDCVGHGAIKYYYSLGRKNLTERECTDFNSPKRFPLKLVKAIKAGEMFGLGIDMSMFDMLLKNPWLHMDEFRRQARNEFLEQKHIVWDEYCRALPKAKVKDMIETKYNQGVELAYNTYHTKLLKEFTKIFNNTKNRKVAWR